MNVLMSPLRYIVVKLKKINSFMTWKKKIGKVTISNIQSAFTDKNNDVYNLINLD